MQHGTISTYTNHKCRCDLCRTAWREWYQGYNDKRRDRRNALNAEKYRERINFAREYLGGVCRSCGSREELEFDHIERDTKSGNVTQMLHLSLERLKEELDKCQLLCKTCHLDKTIAEKPDVPHGTVLRYGRGCRCNSCRLTINSYNREKRLARISE